MPRRTAPAVRLTHARRGLSEDVSGRTRRYLVMMGIRTACFGLALITDGWLRWAFVVGAVLLPYFGVVLANGGREPVSAENLPTPDGGVRSPGIVPLDPLRPRRELPPATPTRRGPETGVREIYVYDAHSGDQVPRASLGSPPKYPGRSDADRSPP